MKASRRVLAAFTGMIAGGAVLALPLGGGSVARGDEAQEDFDVTRGESADMKAARELLVAERYPEAEAAYRKVLKNEPDSERAWAGLASALSSQNDPRKEEEARKAYLAAGAAAQRAAAARGKARVETPPARLPTQRGTPVQAPVSPLLPEVPASTRPPAAAAPQVEIAPPQAGDHIDLMTITAKVPDKRMIIVNYWFLPDGTVYFGVPPKGATFEALLKSEPANCGTYGITGTHMTIHRNGKPPSTVNYIAGHKINDALMMKVVYFDAGQKLDGAWGGGASLAGMANGARFTAAGLSSWTFRKDGTFEGASGTSFNNERSGVAVGESKATKGTYELTDGEVKLTYEDGMVKNLKIAGSDDKADPYILCVGDHSYVKRR